MSNEHRTDQIDVVHVVMVIEADDLAKGFADYDDAQLAALIGLSWITLRSDGHPPITFLRELANIAFCRAEQQRRNRENGDN